MSENNVRYITTMKEIRVVNDPYRREILIAMSLLDKPVSAKEVADYMEEPPSKVNYHIGILHKYGFIDLHHTENINGIIAKFYLKSSSVFKIQMDGKNAKPKEISAIRDIVASTFDIARDIFITQIAKNSEIEGNSTSPTAPKSEYEEEFIFSKKVYMSNDELKELNEFIDRVARNKKDVKKLYSFFASYTEIDDYSEK